jgi:hypothetical protein
MPKSSAGIAGWEVDTNVPSAGLKTINIFVAWKNLQASKAFSLSVQKSNI